MTDLMRMYSRQEYLTPGAAETVDLIADAVKPTDRTLLLDVASGKGEAAAVLAGRFACRVLCVDMYDPFIQYAAAKFWHFNLRDLVSVVRADGAHLPVRDRAFDAAYCIGAPSIVGLESALGEMARAVRPGGSVIVSDAVWRTKPDVPLGPEWGWLAEAAPVTQRDYQAALEAAGLVIERNIIFPVTAWEDYFAPMLQVAKEARAGDAIDPFFASEVEETVALERRALETYLDYAAFIARRP